MTEMFLVTTVMLLFLIQARQIDRQTERQIDRQTDRKAGRQGPKNIYRMSGRQRLTYSNTQRDGHNPYY